MDEEHDDENPNQLVAKFQRYDGRVYEKEVNEIGEFGDAFADEGACLEVTDSEIQMLSFRVGSACGKNGELPNAALWIDFQENEGLTPLLGTFKMSTGIAFRLFARLICRFVMVNSYAFKFFEILREEIDWNIEDLKKFDAGFGEDYGYNTKPIERLRKFKTMFTVEEGNDE